MHAWTLSFTAVLRRRDMCAEGTVCIAILALAIIFTLPGARSWASVWFGVGAHRTLNVRQRCAKA